MEGLYPLSDLQIDFPLLSPTMSHVSIDTTYGAAFIGLVASAAYVSYTVPLSFDA